MKKVYQLSKTVCRANWGKKNCPFVHFMYSDGAGPGQIATYCVYDQWMLNSHRPSESPKRSEACKTRGNTITIEVS